MMTRTVVLVSAALWAMCLVGCGADGAPAMEEPTADGGTGADSMARVDALPALPDAMPPRADAMPQVECTATDWISTTDDCAPDADGSPRQCIDGHCVPCGKEGQSCCGGTKLPDYKHHCDDFVIWAAPGARALNARCEIYAPNAQGYDSKGICCWDGTDSAGYPYGGVTWSNGVPSCVAVP
jgi:hypothetical protein